MAAIALMAADPAWMNKPVSDWDQRDARQVLAGSPWVKYVIPAPLPAQSEAQRGDGGVMGGGRSVGLEAFAASNLIGIGPRSRPEESDSSRDGPQPLAIRWESALPVRNAESRAGGQNPPRWNGEFYVIAVYGVQAPPHPKEFENELKRTSYLKLDKKLVQPARVDIVPTGKGLARILYLFPRSRPITTESAQVEFIAEMGQYYVAQFFNPREMQLQGKLEL